MILTGGSVNTGFPILDRLDWATSAVEACVAVRDLLEMDRDLPERLAAYVASMRMDDIQLLLKSSTEKSTHYKWFLGGGESYRAWLHEYKKPEVFKKATSYAASVHNHRYPFVSIVLSGGMMAKTYRLDCQRLFPDRDIVLRSGSTSLLTSTDIHQIVSVEPETFTLVVQGPIERSFSCVWDLQAGTMQKVFDLNKLFAGLSSRLPT